ncbi:MAG TPA: hypothetical protein VGE69_13240 [Pseudomonadales bacterium]
MTNSKARPIPPAEFISWQVVYGKNLKISAIWENGTEAGGTTLR